MMLQTNKYAKTCVWFLVHHYRSIKEEMIEADNTKRVPFFF
jgi:hypothetical protein